MIDITPNPLLGSLGPIEIRWYGLAYVAAITGGTWLATREARRRGERTDVIFDGLIFIAVAALIGGRLYHVIDQWSYYSSHLAQIVLPPYSGLGVFGGLFTGLLATLWYTRQHHLDFWRWADILAPAILLAQVIGRWGNFANQELYGPPTNLPWGIAIQCQYRIPQYACPVGSAVDLHKQPGVQIAEDVAAEHARVLHSRNRITLPGSTAGYHEIRPLQIEQDGGHQPSLNVRKNR